MTNENKKKNLSVKLLKNSSIQLFKDDLSNYNIGFSIYFWLKYEK